MHLYRGVGRRRKRKDKNMKKEKRSGKSSMERTLEHSKSQSVQAVKKVPIPTRSRASPHPSLRIKDLSTPYQHQTLSNKRILFPNGVAIYQLDRKALERDLFSQRKVLEAII